MIPHDKIEQVKNASDIVEIVSSYMTLQRAGVNFKANCPFHNEKTASFIVSPVKQICHCFGCGEGGNVFTFVQKIENISFVESVKLLADRAGIVIEEEKYSPQKQEQSKLIEIMKEAVKFYKESLAENAAVKEYLASRGLENDTIEEFHIGYAPGGNALAGHLKSKGFEDAMIVRAWLAKSENGIYDIFRDRVMFPIFNALGEPVAFGGRVLGDGLPKYINSAESEIYVKGRTLYNLNNARRQRTDRIAITEGYTDAIAVSNAGCRGVVATLGTALTHEQAKLLKRYTQKAVIVYDMDDAGRQGAARGGAILFEHGFDVYVASYEGAKDPDDYIKLRGKEDFIKRFEEAEGYIDYMINYLKSKGDTANSYYKEECVKEIAGIIENTESEVVRSDAVKKVSYRLNVPQEIAVKYFKQVKTSGTAAPLGISADVVRLRGGELAERIILKAVLSFSGTHQQEPVLKHIFNRMKLENLSYADFKSGAYAPVLEKAEVLYSGGQKNVAEGLQNFFSADEDAVKLMVALIAEDSEKYGEKGPEIEDAAAVIRVIDDCFARIKKDKLTKELEAMNERIAAAEQEEAYETLTELVKEKQEIQKKLKQRGGTFE